MTENSIKSGVYPTMITPFHEDKSIDIGNIEKLVDWYYENGCGGIFALCQSSEMSFLNLKEKVEVVRSVVKKNRGRMTVVASGHTESSLEKQIEEIYALYEIGIDAFVFVTNKLDINNEGDKTLIRFTEKLLTSIPQDLKLGLYECPSPFKRLLTTDVLKWCISTGRFAFIKDTCCDPPLLEERLKLLEGTGIKLFNANGQTLLMSLKHGAAGYSGVMANFHPDLYVWLYENFKKYPEKAEIVQSHLSALAFTEHLCYPTTAKYHAQLIGFDMNLYCRTNNMACFKPYDRLCVEQIIINETAIRRFIAEGT